MPKTDKLTALKRTRRVLKAVKIEIADSSSESDALSEESAEFSHVPLDNVPNLENLFLNDSEEFNMEQLATQVNALTQVLEEIRNQQLQQQQALNALSQGQAQASANAQQRSANITIDSLFKIPDPIKAIPKFDGNRKQLSAWLTTAENTLNVFRDLVSDGQYNIFVTAVINKIEGRAKDIICLAGNPQSFDEVKLILTNALGDRQELTYYKSQLWQTRMTDNMTVHKYYNRCKEIVQNIKTLAKQKQKYQTHWEAINSFIEEDALAAFLAGLKEPYFGYAQAAKPEDMEAAYAFVCKFQCKETTASNMDTFSKKSNHFTRDYKPQEKFSRKPPFNNNKTEKLEKENDTSQPMDIGSTRSKLTLNRRQVNNTELADSDRNSESESEHEEVDINFCLAHHSPTTT
jgi:hypothetical protein